MAYERTVLSWGVGDPAIVTYPKTLSSNKIKKKFLNGKKNRINSQEERRRFIFLSGSVEGGGVSLLPILWLLFFAIHLCFWPTRKR